MWILNICVFASTSENEALIFYFKKIILKIKKNCLALSIFLSFFIKILCQSKEFPLSTQSTLKSNPSLLEKIFHPHPHCQIRGSQSLEEGTPFRKGGVWTMDMLDSIFFWTLHVLI